MKRQAASSTYLEKVQNLSTLGSITKHKFLHTDVGFRMLARTVFMNKVSCTTIVICMFLIQVKFDVIIDYNFIN